MSVDSVFCFTPVYYYIYYICFSETSICCVTSSGVVLKVHNVFFFSVRHLKNVASLSLSLFIHVYHNKDGHFNPNLLVNVMRKL